LAAAQFVVLANDVASCNPLINALGGRVSVTQLLRWVIHGSKRREGLSGIITRRGFVADARS
jgi:hypothetical protein